MTLLHTYTLSPSPFLPLILIHRKHHTSFFHQDGCKLSQLTLGLRFFCLPPSFHSSPLPPLVVFAYILSCFPLSYKICIFLFWFWPSILIYILLFVLLLCILSSRTFPFYLGYFQLYLLVCNPYITFYFYFLSYFLDQNMGL